MQNVSIKKYAEMCYIKDPAYVRQLLLNSKLIGQKQGREWIIDIENPLNAEYLRKRRQEYEMPTFQNTVETPAIPTENTKDYEIQNTQLIRELINEIKELAEEKGKTKLLSDNLMQKEHDVEYWKEKYFEIQHKYETLLQEATELKTKLKADLNKPWWKKKVF